MTKKISAGFVLLALALVVSGCGFHLRGAVDLPESLQQIAIGGTGFSRDLRRRLESSLRSNGVEVVKTADTGIPELRIVKEAHTKRAVTLNASGNVRDFDLSYSLEFLLAGTTDEILLPRQSIRVQRNFKYDQTDVLGKANEEKLLRRELLNEAVDQLLSRLRSLKEY